MSFAHRYIQTAEKIILTYDGTFPLHYYLKQFFAADKKYGSKDRKAISHAVYCYYRLGNNVTESITAKIKLGLFLCNDSPGKWNDVFDENWIINWHEDVNDRLNFVQSRININQIFSFIDEVSEQIDKTAFVLSHLKQPDLHLRIRPGGKEKVLKQLSDAAIPSKLSGDSCLALPNGTKIDQLLHLNKDVVVQDMSSQRVGELMMKIPQNKPLKVWDCCAASGGKSILAYDLMKNMDLTVSDVRTSIITNLKKRFTEAGIQRYKAFVNDLTSSQRSNSKEKFDLIICDAPCSGSGTWSRTPEQLSFFGADKISYYAALQQRIVSSVIPLLSSDGYLLYITCSVYKKENEGVVKDILNRSGLRLVEMKYFTGYNERADTMFAALFTASTP